MHTSRKHIHTHFYKYIDTDIIQKAFNTTHLHIFNNNFARKLKNGQTWHEDWIFISICTANLYSGKCVCICDYDEILSHTPPPWLQSSSVKSRNIRSSTELAKSKFSCKLKSLIFLMHFNVQLIRFNSLKIHKFCEVCWIIHFKFVFLFILH